MTPQTKLSVIIRYHVELCPVLHSQMVTGKYRDARPKLRVEVKGP
jgi:hypothetical protein